MEKCLKSLISLLMTSVFIKSQICCAIDVAPEGRFIRNKKSISKNPTVQMFFDANNPPIINVTPGRPTIVQFPSEVRSCFSATNLIKIDYADKTSGSEQNSKNSSPWYSALIINSNGESIQKMRIEDIIAMPATDVTCQIKNINSDSNRETYSWKIIGVKIANPEDTHIVVYLLDSKNSLNSGLPTEQELLNNGESYIDFKKLTSSSNKHNNLKEKSNHKDNLIHKNNDEIDVHKNDTDSVEKNTKRILTNNKNQNQEEQNISNMYEFSSISELPPSPM